MLDISEDRTQKKRHDFILGCGILSLVCRLFTDICSYV